MRKHAVALAALSLLAGLTAPARAQFRAPPGDWPGWRGPDRTGLSTETGLLASWPEGGPKLLWKATGLGDGFSTPSIAGGRIYLMGTRGRTELLLALDVKDGKRLWDAEVGSMAGGRPGPRSTPTVDGDRVYALSSDGKLVCVPAGGGQPLWKKDFRADFGGRHGRWAYAESPLVDGDVLVCTPGGDGAALVALNKLTGDVIWKSPVKGAAGRRQAYSTAGYSSAIVAEAGGVKQYVQFLAGGVVGVKASDGTHLWSYNRPANGTANCSTPIFKDGCVLAASAYSTGGGMARLVPDGDKFEAKQEYFLSSLQNHHGGLVLVGDHVYGTGSNALYCVDFKTGKVAWSNRSVGKGSVAYADGHLYVRGERGGVALVEATPSGYKEKGRFEQPGRSAQPAWPYPVVAGGRLYLRDWDALFCYDVKGK